MSTTSYGTPSPAPIPVPVPTSEHVGVVPTRWLWSKKDEEEAAD